MINPDNLQNYPDHTSEMEKLESMDGVDLVIPRHMGGDQSGRFCLAFMVISKRSAKVFSLTGKSENFKHELVYEFTLEN